MPDNLSSEKRSWNMSQIKSKNTKPEIIVRKLLFSNGYRYRLHKKDLPGSPDLVLKKYKTVIFVNGCFWHQHENCNKAHLPKSRVEYWKTKLEKNVIRDKRNYQQLQSMDWKVIIIWECEIKNRKELLKKIENKLRD